MRRTPIALAALTLVAFCLSAAALSASSKRTITPPAAWATLAFSRTGGDAGIFLVGPRGVRLFARDAAEPSWSPDGRRLAYVARGAGGFDDVFVADADGNPVGQITRTPLVDEFSPTWSPDGTRLAFQRDGRVIVTSGDGSRERVVARGYEPAWAPGGRQIAFERDGDLYVARVAGGSLRRLTNGPATEQAPAWSPDGRRLTYVSDETGTTDLRVLDVRTRAQTPLTADSALDASPAFSADGRRIVFASDRGGAEALWRVPARGGAAEPLGVAPFSADPNPRPTPGHVELLPDFDQQPPKDLDVRSAERRHRLWFTSAADNVGIGPFIVNGRRAAAKAAMSANQRVRLADGSLRTYPAIGIWRFNATTDHSHWHLMRFQRYELRRADGSVVVRDRKSGFCIGDRYGVAADRVEGSVPRPVFRGFCNLYQPGSMQVDGGTSVGYSDRYHSRLDGQNLDITSVPAGEYVLVNRANPVLLIRELRYENNAGSVRIRITRRKGGPPSVRVLRTCADSDRC